MNIYSEEYLQKNFKNVSKELVDIIVLSCYRKHFGWWESMCPQCPHPVATAQT